MLGQENRYLRNLLKQAGIDIQTERDKASAAGVQHKVDIEHERDKATAANAQHKHDIESERVLTRAAQRDADEIRHRLKNTLAIVQAIAAATLTGDISLEQARNAFEARLAALAHAHDILVQAGWTTAKLDLVINGILSPYADANRIRSAGPHFEMAPKPALALALAVHELATNAAKYGALSNEAGHVEIGWTIAAAADGEEFQLQWRERNGPPVAAPSRKGFGTRLIERNLASEFNGTVDLEFPPEGLTCTIRAPASALRDPHLPA